MTTAKLTTEQTTKAKLTATLKDLGLTAKDFKSAQTGYDGMYSLKAKKATKGFWTLIGNTLYKAKSHLAANKQNPNKGLLNEFCKTYFPALTSQDISNSIWLAKYETEVDEFIDINKVNRTNPASIKMAIRKTLKDDPKATKATYEAIGMVEPKPKVTHKKDAETGEVVPIIDNKKANELLPALAHIIEALEKQVKKNAKVFSDAELNELQKLSFQLADIQINADTKNGVIRQAA